MSVLFSLDHRLSWYQICRFLLLVAHVLQQKKHKDSGDIWMCRVAPSHQSFKLQSTCALLLPQNWQGHRRWRASSVLRIHLLNRR